MGRKATINRCMLYPLQPAPLSCNQFLVLGCHFGRSEVPFYYDAALNKYVKFQKQELFVDMYRSNDVVQFDENFIYVRTFAKIGEPSESVKVFKFFLRDAVESTRPICNPEESSNGPDKVSVQRGFFGASKKTRAKSIISERSQRAASLASKEAQVATRFKRYRDIQNICCQQAVSKLKDKRK